MQSVGAEYAELADGGATAGLFCHAAGEEWGVSHSSG